MADHNKPVVGDIYANVLTYIDQRLDDLLLGLDPAVSSQSNLPTNTIRWNSALGKWQKWNGTNWDTDLASVYNININGTVNGTTIPGSATLTKTTDKLSVFSSTSSAELAGVISDETGYTSGALLVFSKSPTIETPTITLKLGTTPTAEGAIQWDNTNDKIIIGDGTGQKHFIPTSMFSTDITVSTTGVVTIGTNVVSNTKLRDSTALSVIGRSANSTGDPADIIATAASGAVLRESGSTIGFGQIDTAAYANSSSSTTGVTYAKMQYVSATNKILGRSTAGSGVIEEITCTAAGRDLLDDVDASAQRTTLGMGSGSAIATLIGTSAVTNAQNISNSSAATFTVDGAERMRIGAGGKVSWGSDTDFAAYPSTTAPMFVFDANDAFYYDRTNNIFNMMIGSSNYFSVASTGVVVARPTGLGYGAGAGGAVIQSTSKTTAVTLNKPCGRILTHNASLGANTTVSFDLNCSVLTGADVLVLSIAGAGSGSASYQAWASPGEGVAKISIRNITGGSLSEAIPLNFAIIKAAQS